MGVAVHTGTVVVGNIGSEQRSKYGAVGFDVNFTGRIESYTVGGQVLISEATHKKVASHAMVKEILNLEMKGIPGKVNLYDIHGMKAPYNILLPERDETPTALKHSIKAVVSCLDQKIVDSEGIEAIITHTSQTSAILLFSQAISQWQDIRVHLPGPDQPLDSKQTLNKKGGEFYGKVVQATMMDSAHRALVRITSLSPEAQKLFSPDRN
jgi:sigma-B regulation protein RsbU (phosphoserine phosphatase)